MPCVASQASFVAQQSALTTTLNTTTRSSALMPPDSYRAFRGPLRSVQTRHIAFDRSSPINPSFPFSVFSKNNGGNLRLTSGDFLPASCKKPPQQNLHFAMGLTRLELVTPSLSEKCSNRLSYRPQEKRKRKRRSLCRATGRNARSAAETAACARLATAGRVSGLSLPVSLRKRRALQVNDQARRCVEVDFLNDLSIERR